MASRRRTKITAPIVTEIEDNSGENKDVIEEKSEQVEAPVEITTPVVTETPKKTEKKSKVEPKKIEVETKPAQKFKIGSIVFISKDAQADLNGFKLFPQYKKYTYTVEAYNDDTGVYSLRRLNLSLKLREADIVAPHEKSDSSLIRRQF